MLTEQKICTFRVRKTCPSWYNIVTQPADISATQPPPAHDYTSGVYMYVTHCNYLVSKPDPQKNRKEGLGYRLGWKCTELNVWLFVIISLYPLYFRLFLSP